LPDFRSLCVCVCVHACVRLRVHIHSQAQGQSCRRRELFAMRCETLWCDCHREHSTVSLTQRHHTLSQNHCHHHPIPRQHVFCNIMLKQLYDHFTRPRSLVYCAAHAVGHAQPATSHAASSSATDDPAPALAVWHSKRAQSAWRGVRKLPCQRPSWRRRMDEAGTCTAERADSSDGVKEDADAAKAAACAAHRARARRLRIILIWTPPIGLYGLYCQRGAKDTH